MTTETRDLTLKQQITELETKLRRCRDANKCLRDTLAGKSAPAARRKTREEIFAALENGTHTVANLASAANVCERTVWRHLSALLAAGAVKRVDARGASPHTFTATETRDLTLADLEHLTSTRRAWSSTVDGARIDAVISAACADAIRHTTDDDGAPLVDVVGVTVTEESYVGVLRGEIEAFDVQSLLVAT